MTNKVTSLKWAKKLKESGYVQEGEFYWSLDDEATRRKGEKVYHLAKYPECTHYDCYSKQTEHYSAPLTDELLERLPNEVEVKERFYIITIIPQKDDSAVFYKCKNERCYNCPDVRGGMPCNKYGQVADKLPDALAEMYVFLSKEGLP